MLLAPHLPKSRLDHEVGQAFLVPDIELDIGGVGQRAGPKAGELTRRNGRTIDQTLSRTPFLKIARRSDSTSSANSDQEKTNLNVCKSVFYTAVTALQFCYLALYVDTLGVVMTQGKAEH